MLWSHPGGLNLNDRKFCSDVDVQLGNVRACFAWPCCLTLGDTRSLNLFANDVVNVKAFTMPGKHLDENPSEDPQNYFASSMDSHVTTYKLIAELFSPKIGIEKGALCVDVVKNKIGKCLFKGFIKGKEGERVTIAGRRRNHHAALEDCVAVPAPFVQNKDGHWFKINKTGDPKKCELFPLYVPRDPDQATLDEEQAIKDMFGDGDIDEAEKPPSPLQAPVAVVAGSGSDGHAASVIHYLRLQYTRLRQLLGGLVVDVTDDANAAAAAAPNAVATPNGL